jgi:hypothetical protein
MRMSYFLVLLRSGSSGCRFACCVDIALFISSFKVLKSSAMWIGVFYVPVIYTSISESFVLNDLELQGPRPHAGAPYSRILRISDLYK